MKNALGSMALLAIAAAIAPQVFGQSVAQVRALPRSGSFSITNEYSKETSDKGAFLDSASVTRTAAGTFAGRALSAAATLSTQARDFKDVHKNADSMGLNLNYGLSNNTELFGRLRRTNADGKEFDALNVSAAVSLGGVQLAGANAALQGKLNDYKSTDLDIGVRYFFPTDTSFKPYVAPSVGISRVDAIQLQFLSFRGTNTLARSLNFYNASNAYRYGLNVGFRYDVARNVAIGLETGLQYQQKLSANSEDLGDYKTNSSGKRSYIPLTIGVNIAF